MSTISRRSAGTQATERGIVKGEVLVDPVSGLPISVVTDMAGKKRLAVDAAVSVTIPPHLNVDVDYTEDSVHIGDSVSNNLLVIEADGSINVNVKVDAADGDNIAIKDAAGDALNINPDGSINVVITSSNAGVFKSFYNEVTSVATSVLTTITTYTAPAGKTTYIQKAEVSGTNIAEFTLEINGSVIDKKRTYFGNSLNTEFTFADDNIGLLVSVGDIVRTRVIHSRPVVGNFNSRIQVIEV
jgi:hypothetical protein